MTARDGNLGDVAARGLTAHAEGETVAHVECTCSTAIGCRRIEVGAHRRRFNIRPKDMAVNTIDIEPTVIVVIEETASEAIVRQRRPAFAGVDEFLRRLRPTRVRRVGIHVGGEIVFAGPVTMPKRCRPFGGKFDFDN